MSGVDLNQEYGLGRLRDGLSSSVTDNYLAALQTAVIEFINAMRVGDNVAIIKFNNSSGASVVVPFTDIKADNCALEDAVMADYPGDGPAILDATNLGASTSLRRPRFPTARRPSSWSRMASIRIRPVLPMM